MRTKKKSVEISVYASPEDNQLFSEFASAAGLSKSELLIRATRFRLTHTDSKGVFIAPQFTIDKMVGRLASLAIEKAKERELLTVNEGEKID